MHLSCPARSGYRNNSFFRHQVNALQAVQEFFSPKPSIYLQEQREGKRERKSSYADHKIHSIWSVIAVHELLPTSLCVPVSWGARGI